VEEEDGSLEGAAEDEDEVEEEGDLVVNSALRFLLGSSVSSSFVDAGLWGEG
jgi:hypothetical protein